MRSAFSLVVLLNNIARRAAVKWVEEFLASPNNDATNTTQKVIKRRPSMLKKLQSNLSGSSMTVRMSSFFGDETIVNKAPSKSYDSGVDGGAVKIWHNLAVFSAGLSLGLVIASRMSHLKSV